MTRSPRIAVITPYYKEPLAVLARCVDSVLAQSFACTHFLIADGFPLEEVDSMRVRHLRLDRGHADFGDTPRGIGSLIAIREGYDAICYLDADNFYLPGHVAGLVHTWEQSGRQLDAIRTERHFLYPDGRRMRLREQLSDDFCDTNCLFLAAHGLALCSLWITMPAPLHCVGDRIIWHALRARQMRIAHLPVHSVAYTSLWRAHYRALGEVPPPQAKDIGNETAAALAWWRSLPADQNQQVIAHLGFDPAPMLLSV